MLSKNFSRQEFECECKCGFNAVDVELLAVLEKTRNHFNKPIIITGGNRCKMHNEKVQLDANKNYKPLSSNSKHMQGTACDFKVKDIPSDIVADYLEQKYPISYGIGRYNGRTHLDIREIRARW